MYALLLIIGLLFSSSSWAQVCEVIHSASAVQQLFSVSVLGVINGVVAGELDPDTGEYINRQYKGVVKVHSKSGLGCTGSVVNLGLGKLTILTAAHCADSVLSGGIFLNVVRGKKKEIQKIHSDRAFVLPGIKSALQASDYKVIPSSLANQDIAIVTFDTEDLNLNWRQFPTLKIATEAPEIGDPVRIVGHGKVSEAHSKRQFATGTNAIGRFDDDIIAFWGRATIYPDGERGKDVSASHGDSGAPLLNDRGEIIGIYSNTTVTPRRRFNERTGNFESQKESRFASVINSKVFQELLNMARAEN